MTSAAAVASIVRPTAPTLFHSLHFSSSRPLFVLYELGVVADDGVVAPPPDAKKAKTTENASSKKPPPPPVHVVHITYEQLKNDPVLGELNPQKRLPFYYDPIHDLKLSESGGLVQYLLETYDVDHALYPPPHHATRADFLSLLHFGPATAYHIGVPILFPGPDVAEKKKQWHDIVAVTLERSLQKYGGSGPYLLGEQFCAVDAVIAYDLVTVAASSAADELFEKHPALQAYHALLQERPAYQKTFPPSDEKEESK